MLSGGQRNEGGCEHLVLVVVHYDVLGISVARGEKIVPRAGRQEAVVEDDGGVGDGANLTVGIAVELADCGFG